MEQRLKTGQSLQGGTYRIEKVLGQGSFGITYLATTTTVVKGKLGEMKIESHVALKEFFMSEINSRKSDGSTVEGSTGNVFTNYRKKFRREAENLAKLSHPNIVKVFDVFDENNTTYYVMEYLEGTNLDDYIAHKGSLSEAESIAITREIGDALSYMHSHKMLHLDIKPKNIMRKPDGTSVLIDFGLAKQYTEDDEPESSTSIGLGTPGYAPLEQSSYKQDGTFPATLDVYALGATLFKMLTGQRPPEATIILNEDFPTQELINSGVSDETISVVQKAMAPIRKHRYQDIDSFITAFKSIVIEKTIEHIFSQEKTIIIDSDISVISSEQTGFINDHEYVDLGLPSGLKWATCNIGATTPEGYGNYYAWGETTTKSEYNPSNSTTYKKSFGDISGNSYYDAARANWGQPWRLPKRQDFIDLIDNCNWKLIKNGNHNVYEVTGPNGNSIYFPIVGYRYGYALFDEDECCFYWSASPANDSDSACVLYLNNLQHYTCWRNRYYGFPIRAVSDYQKNKKN